VIHETIPALQRLKAEGEVRFIGVTGYWPHILAHIAESASLDVALNYCHWNLMMDDMDVVLTPVARRQELGLMNGSPLHMGLLGGNAGPDWHPAPPTSRLSRPGSAVYAENLELTQRSWLSMPVSSIHLSQAHLWGPRSVDEVNDALGALHFRPSAELMEKLSELIAPVFNTTWRSGLPENQPPLEDGC
jgi:L-galactose dehydrogenase